MFGRVVGDTVLPHAPDHPQPSPPEDAYGVRVVAAASPRPPVDVAGPGMVVAGSVGKRGHGVTQAFVAGPAEGRHLALAGFDRHRACAGVGGQSLDARVALAAIAYLRHEAGGGDRRLGVAKERKEELAVGWARTE